MGAALPHKPWLRLMNYSVIDAGGLLLAILSYIPLLLAPGFALGAASDLFGFRRSASLFGAPEAAVTRRGNELFPIFALSLPVSVVRARAAANGIGALIVTADDPVWADRTSWVWTTPPVYASPRVRIVAVRALGGKG